MTNLERPEDGDIRRSARHGYSLTRRTSRAGGEVGSRDVAPEGIEVRMLGPVRARRDGIDLPFGAGRREGVLCLLALQAGQNVTREHLISSLWGDYPPKSAAGNLYNYVSSLRQMLEPARGRWGAGHLLSSDGGSYRLHVSPESIDVVQFEALRETARCHRATGDTAAELTTLESALHLWQGDPLSGIPGPFAAAQRLRLSELHLASADRYAALLAQTGLLRPGFGRRRTGLTGHPERAVHGDGRLPDQSADRETQPGSGDLPSGNPFSLIGRDAEIRRLRRAATEAAAGRGSSVLVEAGPGMGRSALLEATARNPPPGCRVAHATGDDVSPRRPLGLLLDCLESTIPDLTAADAERAADVIAAAASETPLILIADDLHLADPATLRVWSTLAERAAHLPLLLVGAARSGSPEVLGVPADEVVELAPLDDDAATVLLHSLAPEPPDSAEVDRILGDAAGNPSYLRVLASGDTVAPSATIAMHLGAFPEDIHQLLRAVAFLSAHEWTAPGTLTPGCSTTELTAAVGCEQIDLRPAIASGVLNDDGERLTFGHRVVARTLHEGTPAALRITLHRCFAERLGAAGAPPERVAAQLLAGDVPFDEAVRSWLAKHVEPLGERAPQIAIAALRQARAQFALDPGQRLHFTATLARLLLQQGHNAAADAGWVAARTTDPELKGEMRWVAAHNHERRAEFEDAATIAHAALREPIGPQWVKRLRTLLARIRRDLPGVPTAPHITQSSLADDDLFVAR